MLDHAALIVIIWSVADAIEYIAEELSDEYYESFMDEVEALRSLAQDLQHQKDTLDTIRSNIRHLSELRHSH